jgi:hypothetical protein
VEKTPELAECQPMRYDNHLPEENRAEAAAEPDDRGSRDHEGALPDCEASDAQRVASV